MSGIMMTVATSVSTTSSSSSLYSFTNFRFTNTDATGNTGPLLANATSWYTGNAFYSGNSWLSNTSYYNVTGGIQYWTVPTTGSYTISAVGAAGNGNIGLGANITGTFSLTQGEVVRILVGQTGGNINQFYGGGGGGSFVIRTPYNTANSIAVIAGGGAGMSWRGGVGVGNVIPGRGSATTAPGTTAFGLATGGGGGGIQGAGGTTGANGTSTASGGWAGGGGGFLGNGGSSSGAGSGGQGGKSFTNGGTGGQGQSAGQFGGFGGGGGAGSSGGGGGGYNGGNGSTDNNIGGGAGSYNNGTSPSATANANPGNGFVQVTYNG